MPDLAASTACGLARRVAAVQWAGVEAGIAAVHQRMLDLLPAAQRALLCRAVTIDIDATDVEVYGRQKRGVAYNYQGQRCGRPDVASWAQTETVLAADLLAGDQDPRSSVVALLHRALDALPTAARAGDVAVRVDAGYFAGDLARAARAEGVAFAIGAKRIAPLWRLLSGIDESVWIDAIDMTGAQVAVADYAPAAWPAGTRCLIRWVRLSPDQVSVDARSRRRRTLHPDQRALPLDELAAADAIYAYSFILTDRDVSTGERAVTVEHWYRHRTSVENVFRDGKHGAALCHLPSGHEQVNRAWMWGALLAVSIAGWAHQLTGVLTDAGVLVGHGVCGGKAMIATLRWRLIAIPARLVRHAGQLILRPPPGYGLLAEILARIRALPASS
ncbi:MAG: transposase [Sciscionella sp.]